MNKHIDITILDMPNPTPEEIMKEGFSLPEFIEKQLKIYHKPIGDEAFDYFDREEMPKQTEFDKIENMYFFNVEKITWAYKNDLKLGKVKEDWYTEKLIELTKQYLEELKKYKLLKQKQELLKQKKKIELEQLEKKQRQNDRINRYKNGEIEIYDLYFEDLDYIKIDKIMREKLERMKRRIINVDFKQSKIIEEKIDTMTIRELAEDYKESKGKTK